MRNKNKSLTSCIRDWCFMRTETCTSQTEDFDHKLDIRRKPPKLYVSEWQTHGTNAKTVMYSKHTHTQNFTFKTTQPNFLRHTRADENKQKKNKKTHKQRKPSLLHFMGKKRSLTPRRFFVPHGRRKSILQK